MPTLLKSCGEDELYHGRSYYTNSTAHMDVYGPPCKRPRTVAPFTLWVDESEQKRAASIDDLPDECLLEILRRLPGRERSISACVSYHWLTLLSSLRRAELFHDDVDMVSEDKQDGVSRFLEGKKATDTRVASIAVKMATRGGLEKLSIRGSNSTHGVTDFGLSAVARGCPSLKSLSLWSVPFVGDEGLAEIANECSMLEKLDLCHCPLVTNKGLISIAKKCPNLTTLSIESCPKIVNDTIQAIAQGCPKLESISIKDCPLVGDQAVACLLSSSSSVLSKLKLQKLNISDFSLAVIGHYGKSLVSLTLSNLQNVSEKGFWVMGKAQGLKSLVFLSIALCSGLTDLSLEAIAKGCLTLKQISLRHCSIISDKGLLAFSKYAQSLESLNLEDCGRVTLSGLISALANLGSEFKSLSLVKCMSLKDLPLTTSNTHSASLRSLSVKNCPGFGSSSLAMLSKMCPGLKQVDLSGQYGMTDEGILSLLEDSLSGLVKVNLTGCINLSDKSVQGIARMHGETLKVLNLEGCRKITDVSLSAIAKSCPLLRDLDISNCAITDSGIACLSCSEELNLQILSISGCSNISNKSLPFLIQMGKNLVGLNLKHCISLSPKSVTALFGNLWSCDILC